MIKYLAVHTRYSNVQFGIFIDGELKDCSQEINKKVSKDFIILIKALLEKNNIHLEDLDFIAAHQGPAPFTTLRVSLASVNGLAFATKIPLVGINGLESFLKEYNSNEDTIETDITIALLNAFCEDIYYGIIDNNSNDNIITGCSKYLSFLNKIKEVYPNNKIRFIGNGVNLYKEQIKEIFGEQVYISKELPEMVSLREIGAQAYIKWNKKEISKQLLPLYLKAHSAQINKSVKVINL